MIGRVISTIWSIVLLIALVIWYSIGGWTAVFKAVLAMGGFGLCIAGLLKMRHDRKQCKPGEPPAWVPTTGPGLDQAYVYEEPREEVRLALVRWAEEHPYGEYLPEEQESEEQG